MDCQALVRVAFVEVFVCPRRLVKDLRPNVSGASDVELVGVVLDAFARLGERGAVLGGAKRKEGAQ